jgi:methyltransferase-like protein 22
MSPNLSEMYVALEKRYVFTEHVVAPMYEFFMKILSQEVSGILKFEEISTDFTQYFEYEKCKELVLIKITRR